MRLRPAVHFAHVGLWLMGALALSAQTTPVGDLEEEYFRILQIGGEAPFSSFMIRPMATRVEQGPADSIAHPWMNAGAYFAGQVGDGFRVTPARFTGSAVSSLPFLANDGAMWQGKGLNFMLDAGASFARGPLRVTLRPVVTWSQNQDFDLAEQTRPDVPEYAHPWRVIDLPQRPGLDSHAEILPGESAIELAGKGVVGGLSSRNLWWGPGRQSSVLMSNHAAGFPHLFLGTDGPAGTRIGFFEVQWIFGRMRDSDFIEVSETNEGRYLSGFTLVWTPSFMPGLSLGAARVNMIVTGGDSPTVGDALSALNPSSGLRSGNTDEGNPTGEDPGNDQLASLYFRYLFPESGFEIYGEWARNDSPYDLRDLIVDSDHSQAYGLGFTKVFRPDDVRRIALHGEITSLERPRSAAVRPSGSYYDHYSIEQGYTNRGQVIGSQYGPGGSGQFLGVDLYTPAGRVGVFVDRRSFDNDRALEVVEPSFTEDPSIVFTPEAPSNRYHVAWGLGVRGTLLRANGLEFGGQLAARRHWNRYFVFKNDQWNAQLELNAVWRPGS